MRVSLVPQEESEKMTESITQKICEKCGERAIKIDNDKFGKRTCACGHTWYPTKIKVTK